MSVQHVFRDTTRSPQAALCAINALSTKTQTLRAMMNPIVYAALAMLVSGDLHARRAQQGNTMSYQAEPHVCLAVQDRIQMEVVTRNGSVNAWRATCSLVTRV